MKKYQHFFSENFHFLVVKFSLYLNRCVFLMPVPYNIMRCIFVNLNNKILFKPKLRVRFRARKTDLRHPVVFQLTIPRCSSVAVLLCLYVCGFICGFSFAIIFFSCRLHFGASGGLRFVIVVFAGFFLAHVSYAQGEL